MTNTIDQKKFDTETGARYMAIYMSKKYGYAAIVLSDEAFYVENESPFIRNHETLIAEYENGKKLKPCS